MKDSRKLKKKPRKFKFKKKPQTSQDEKIKLEKKDQEKDSKKAILYNRSFIKNLILNKKNILETNQSITKKDKENRDQKTSDFFNQVQKKVTVFFSKLHKEKKKATQNAQLSKTNSPDPTAMTSTSKQPLVPKKENHDNGEVSASKIQAKVIIETKNRDSLWKNIKNTYKRIEKDLLLALIPIILILILALLNLMNNRVVSQIAQNRLSNIDYQVMVHPFPQVISSMNPYISAQTAIVMDKDSQVILYAKNPTVRFSMASTTKLMTALVGLDYYHTNSILTIKTPHVEGSNLGFYAGEQFSFQDLLYAMMLPSSNEAAYAVAENYPGGKDAFIAKMNDKAKQLHLQNTNYGDPAGLNDDQNFSTVVDLARLSSIVLENPLMAGIVDTKEHMLIDKGGRQIDIKSLNQLLGIDGINGVKTGTTEAAGEVLITSTLQNSHTYIIVVMRSNQRFTDTLSLIHLLTNNISYIQPQFTPGNL